MKYYVGVDMGTASIKVVLVDELGGIAAQAADEYDCAVPEEDWREIEPAVWVQGLDRCMLRLREAAGAEIMGQAAGIGVTGQMHTTCFLDAAGESIRPAIMWNDNRAVPLVQELKERLRGTAADCIANIISSGNPAVNLCWLQRADPESFRRLHKFLIGPDYLVYYLTEHFGTDYCDASISSLFDLHARRWSGEIGELIGLCGEQYPEIRGSSIAAGKVRPELAAKWGLPASVKVVTGTGDNAAAAVAAGGEGQSFAVMSLGTSGVLVFTREALDTSLKGKNILFFQDGRHFKWLV